MDEENEIPEIEISFDKEKLVEKGSRMDNLVTIIDNQTDLLHWLSSFEMPDNNGKGDLYDKWAEQKIKVVNNAMRLIMRCQSEFAKISRENQQASD